ncbi:MAG: hypothetical protein ABI867_18015 [Kofleriaceae bacterium]
MTDDDEPKKPPRASWEAPTPDVPPPRKPRAQKPPPRASWEAPDPDEPIPEAVPAPVSAPIEAAVPAPAPAVSEPIATPEPIAPSISSSWDVPSASAAPAPEPTPVAISEPTVVVSGELADEPLLPLSTTDAELRDAAGIQPLPVPRKRRPPTEPGDDDRDDDGERSSSPKLVMAIVLSGVLGLVIVAFVVFGMLNKDKYVLTCHPDEAVAGQGRGFPPWGTRSLDDEAKWKPIKIPPEAECRADTTADEEELSGWYLKLLVERASTLLTAREVTKIDEAAGMLEQALLHARAPDRRDERKEIERLLGDVGYWRASAKLRDAANALGEAAKQFDAAAAQRPRHVSDAAAWATYVRKLAEQLRAGPSDAAQTSFPPTPVNPGRPPAPAGSALPVEPGSGSDGSAAEPPSVPADAGVPTGGVLL